MGSPSMNHAATAEQMETIMAQRIDDVARDMMAHGVELSWEQIEEMGETRCHWLVSRLGLKSTTTDDGVRYECL